LAMCYFYKGKIFKSFQQFENAMNYYLQALDLLSGTDNDPARRSVYPLKVGWTAGRSVFHFVRWEAGLRLAYYKT